MSKFQTLKKEPIDKVLGLIDEICIEHLFEDITDYYAKLEHDDGGSVIAVYLSPKVPPKAKEFLSSPFHGYRLVRVNTPDGYIKAFFHSKKNEK